VFAQGADQALHALRAAVRAGEVFKECGFKHGQ
jgi:hypothetical protein